MMKKNDGSPENNLGQIGAYATIPFVLALFPLMGGWIGSYLDKWLDTAPYLMYLFILLGFIAGCREVYRIMKKFGEEG